MSVASLFDLTGRVAMVTGGNAGVGKAIAWALASAGASVLLVARRVGVLDDAVYEFQHAGLKAAPLRCDLADRDSLNVLASHAATFFGAPDILVNAAGINPRKPFDTPTDDHWDATLALNLSAPFLLTRALAPAMRQRGWGRVINVASLQGERAFPNSAPYGASKAGLVQLTRAMAEFWSPHGITCNALAPGFFPTAMTDPVLADPARAKAMAQQTMIGRNGAMADLHGAAIFLASDASAYVTGQTLFVDGGYSAR